MKRQRLSLPAVGVSSLMTIFAVLCLAVFALLSIATVRSQTELSLAAARAVESYCLADLEMEQLTARIRLGDIPEEALLQDGVYRLVCPISQTQQLEAELDAQTLAVLRWQVVSKLDLTQNNSPELWSGQQEELP